jgi:hypothetical protein
MLETKPDGVSVRVLKSANWAEEVGFHTVGFLVAVLDSESRANSC